jgi:hypothetical protein
MSGRIYRAVQVFPFSFNVDAGFVHTPPASRRAPVLAKRLIQHRHQTDNPAMKRG